MRFDQFSFGTVRIDGSTCEHDVVIDRGEIRKRKKGPSKRFCEAFGARHLHVFVDPQARRGYSPGAEAICRLF